MRNVIYAINITLDGCYGYTKLIGDDEVLDLMLLVTPTMRARKWCSTSPPCDVG